MLPRWAFQYRSVIQKDNMVLKTGLIALTILATGAFAWSGSENPKWWQTGIIYQVYPRSFKDSNGDGIGDLKGITSKLPYLKELGVAAVWLSPIYPSPQADFGYDISDFTDVDKTYGTLQDFDNLVEESHKLGLKVVLDVVPNHTSDEHPWFIASEDPSHPDHAKYRDFFVWQKGKGWNGDKPPNNWLSVFRGSAWTYSPKRKQFYFHQFLKKQPDLNWMSDAVKEETKKVLRFWLDRKVDGFRIDAVPFLCEDPQLRDEPVSGWTDDKDDHAHLLHIYTQNLNQSYELIQDWRAVIDERQDVDRAMLGEIYSSPEETIRYYGTKEKPGCHFPFNFNLVMDVNQASNSTHFKGAIERWMSAMNDWRWPNWVIGNHDQKRVATRYGPELANSLNMLSLSLPGAAMTYYGEEIGMTDNFIRWEDTLDPQAINKGQAQYLSVSRDPCRTPYQWDDSTSAGFSTNTSTWLPVNPNYWELNVQKQKAGRSHYSIYRRLVEARKSPTMQRGDLKVSEDNGILVIERTLENQPPFILLVNFNTRETEWKHPDLPKMKVFTSSLNSGVQDEQKMKEILRLRPKAAYLLTNSSITLESSMLTIIGVFTLVFTYTRNIFSI